jgi:methionine-rich copper-binding protein CopC
LFRRVIAVIATVASVMAALTASELWAHAQYKSSVPNNGETVTTAPPRVEAYFTETLAPLSDNSLNVLGPGGVDVDNNDSTVNSEDLHYMSVTLQPGSQSGAYTVEWVSFSQIDGHEANGTFSFTIQLPATPTSPVQPTEPPGSGGPQATEAPAGANTTPVATQAAAADNLPGAGISGDQALRTGAAASPVLMGGAAISGAIGMIALALARILRRRMPRV